MYQLKKKKKLIHFSFRSKSKIGSKLGKAQVDLYTLMKPNLPLLKLYSFRFK